MGVQELVARKREDGEAFGFDMPPLSRICHDLGLVIVASEILTVGECEEALPDLPRRLMAFLGPLTPAH